MVNENIKVSNFCFLLDFKNQCEKMPFYFPLSTFHAVLYNFLFTRFNPVSLLLRLLLVHSPCLIHIGWMNWFGLSQKGYCPLHCTTRWLEAFALKCNPLEDYIETKWVWIIIAEQLVSSCVTGITPQKKVSQNWWQVPPVTQHSFLGLLFL